MKARQRRVQVAKKSAAAEIVEEKVFVTREEVDQAIVKLTRRLDDVQRLDPQRIRYDDPSVESAAENFRNTVLSIYGPNSPEYRRFRYWRIQYGSEWIGMDDSDFHKNFIEGLKHTIEAIKNLIRILEERKADFSADTTSRVRAAFEDLDLHQRIGGACAELYRDGHYPDAVLRASLALENFVKEKSGRYDISGSTLMEQVFSVNGPVLAFNALADQSDKDEQRGMMLLFQGTVFAFRNPRAHKLLKDSPEDALESIALISLLAKRLEQTKLVKL
jgi:uncharacterized protein (TIGR02391 family)